MCEESVLVSISNSKYHVLLQLVIEGTDKASVPLLDPNDLNLVAEVSLKVGILHFYRPPIFSKYLLWVFKEMSLKVI